MASNKIQDLEASNGLVNGELAWRAECQKFRTIFRKRAIGAAAPTSPHTFQLISCSPIVVLAAIVRELMPVECPAHSTLLFTVALKQVTP
jgi:hypothetical protein